MNGKRLLKLSIGLFVGAVMMTTAGIPMMLAEGPHGPNGEITGSPLFPLGMVLVVLSMIFLVAFMLCSGVAVVRLIAERRRH